MAISKSDWIQWKNNPVTQEFLQDMLKKADDEIATLVKFAGLNAMDDRWKTGFINGLTWLVDWEPQTYSDFIEEDEKDA